MKKFLVTGGAGFIGSHVAESILEEGLGDVVVLDNLSSGREENILHLGGRMSFVKGDTRERRDVEAACEGVDCVFHQAAFTSAFDSYNKPGLTKEVNVGGTLNVLEAAKKAGVRRVVLASSAAVYGTKSALPNSEDMDPRPESPYAVSKVKNEEDAQAFAAKGIETVCLRYFNAFGPRQDPGSEYSGVVSRFVDSIGGGRAPVIYGDGTQTRDFIYVGDVARANIIAATAAGCGRGEIVNIGTGRETSLLDMLIAIERAFGRKIEPQFRPWRKGDIKRSVADVRRAREMLDFCAGVNLEAGIKRLVSSLR